MGVRRGQLGEVNFGTGLGSILSVYVLKDFELIVSWIANYRTICHKKYDRLVVFLVQSFTKSPKNGRLSKHDSPEPRFTLKTNQKTVGFVSEKQPPTTHQNNHKYIITNTIT